ncbi:MAG: tetratricopeptide (TPR) repeat protein [Cognaticolwellia sp.]|jgi:tetratricopeptide (TPR) repeat protein
MAGLNDEERKELLRMQSLLEVGDYATLFSVGRDISKENLRKSYYDLSRRFHPDRFYRKDLGDDTVLIEDVFAGINLAYQEAGNRLDAKVGEVPSQVPKKRKKRRAPPKPGDADKAVPEAEHGHSVSWNTQEAKARAEEARFRVAQAKRRKRQKKGPEPQVPAAVEQFKQRMLDRLRKAKGHFRAGQAAMEQDNWSKASSSFYLATQFDPRNAKFKTAFEEANANAKRAQADKIVATGENAEQYGSIREAVAHYARAVELAPDHAQPYFKLGKALRRIDEKDRGAIEHLRTAVTRAPGTLEYRLELADAYEANGLNRNANREFMAAQRIDGASGQARAGVKRTR